MSPRLTRHIMGLWSHKLRRKRADEDAMDLIQQPGMPAEISVPVFTVNKRGQGLLFGDL